MFRDQFRIDVIVPRIPEVQRIIASQLFPSVAPNLQKGDEDEGSPVGGCEIAL